MKYTYTVDGQRYMSQQVVPAYGDDDADWKDWYAKKPNGAPLVVYVDRTNPHNAVLVREVMTRPYWIALLGMGLAALGAILGRGGLDDGPQHQRIAAPAADGWIEIKVQKPLRDAMTAKFAGALLLAPASLLIAAFYLLRASPYDWRGGWLVAVCGAAVIWQAWRVRGPWMILRAVSDARLWLPSDPIRRGEKFRVKVEVRALRHMNSLSLFVEAACVKHYLKSSSPGSKYEATKDLWTSPHAHIHQFKLNAGDLLRGDAEFVLPAEQAPTGKSLEKVDKDGWPYCVWEIRTSAWSRISPPAASLRGEGGIAAPLHR